MAAVKRRPAVAQEMNAGSALLEPASVKKGQASIEGSWRLAVSFDGSSEVQQVLGTFLANGAYIQSSSPETSTGHGPWLQTGPETYCLTFEMLFFKNEARAPLTIRICANITVHGNALNAPFRAKLILRDGRHIDVGRGTARGSESSSGPCRRFCLD